MDDALDQWLRTDEDLALLMAHDLRNPLAAIVANLSFLEMVVSPDDAESQDSLRDLRHSTDLLLRLVDNYAAVARLESPRSPALPRSAVAIAPIFATVAARHRDAPDGARLVLAPPPPGLAALAEPGFVEAVVDNLARNALRHLRRGGDARIAAAAQGSHVAITLRDDGARYAADGAEFTRDGQHAQRRAAEGRYVPGAGLYVVALVARTFGGEVTRTREGAVDVLTVTLARAP